MHTLSQLTPAEQLQKLLSKVLSSPWEHARWLNTLSYLENCGARKIAACEHPTLVKEEMLKHAAEEFRHAHYLKKQIGRICSPSCFPHYAVSSLLGGWHTFHYLNSLEVKICRYLRRQNDQKAWRAEVYLLVTYAIEIRASYLYPQYEQALRQRGSPVTVKAILLEEKEHLRDMERGIAHLTEGEEKAQAVCALEEIVYHSWLNKISGEEISL